MSPASKSKATQARTHSRTFFFATSKALLIGLMVLAALTAAPVFGNCTATVTDTSDSVSDTGSLRFAIANTPFDGTICFSLTYPATITLSPSNGPLTFGTSLTISGPGASNLFISGNNVEQVFSISSGVTATISGVTIENGSASYGGGIYSAGTLIVANTTLTGNSASSGGGGITNDGGSLTLSNSTLSRNSAGGSGGGIEMIYGTVTVTASTLSANTASAGGGGINNAYGALTLINDTFSGNSTFYGGAILNAGVLTVTNSTLSGNSASGGGGGILMWYGGPDASVKNTILANNSLGGNCSVISGTIASQGHNLSDDTSCSSYFTQAGDLNSTPAGLDLSGLQNNGGPTQTIALLKTSPTVDAIPLTPTNYCTDVAGNHVTTDQRGVTRPQGPACDIGAFELVQSNFAILYEGAGGHNLQITNVTVEGNIGVGGKAAVQFSGPGTITGSLEFAAPNTGQFHNNNRSNSGPSSVTYNNTPQDVVGGLTNLNLLSSMAGAAPGTDVTIIGTETIQASDGTLETINGLNYHIFDVTSYQENDGKMLTINGAGDGYGVVFNFSNGVNLGGDVTLTGGLTPDMVLWNFVGNGNVQLNNNASSYPLPLAFQGVILAPNNAISLSNANLNGRIYGGDSSDMQIVSGTTINPNPVSGPAKVGAAPLAPGQ